MKLAGANVLVVGLGTSGLAAVRLLLKQGARVIGNDQRSQSEIGNEALALAEQGVRLELGGHDPALFTSVDQIVLSPGVPNLPALEAASHAGVPIASEIELASHFIRGTLIGITGTNGKSTVTTLVGDMCQLTGRPTFVGGNLGKPLVDVVGTAAAESSGVVVVELSSFQLERVDRLHVQVAALLNVTEDHLDRYVSFESYAEAKAAIFRNQTVDDAGVIPAGDPLSARLARSAGSVATFGGEDGAVRIVDNALLDEGSGLRVPLSEIALFGRHNHDNACAAALIARLAGVAPEHIAAALRSFAGLPHRMQFVRRLDGVEYYDDSKATNVGAAAAAIDGLGDKAIVLIAGGRDKGGDYGPLVKRMDARGRAAILIGEAAALIAGALSATRCPTERAPDLDSAVMRSAVLALSGDAVLLAPACSSFDMFRSYAHRGDEFQRAVRELCPTGGRAA